MEMVFTGDCVGVTGGCVRDGLGSGMSVSCKEDGNFAVVDISENAGEVTADVELAEADDVLDISAPIKWFSMLSRKGE